MLPASLRAGMKTESVGFSDIAGDYNTKPSLGQKSFDAESQGV
jgi:hypothetical protein